jgi:histidinol-phosphatase (PHP family)
MGQATEDFSRADRFLDEAPPLDFIIASLHNLSWAYGRKDFCTLEKADEAFARQAIGTYLEEMLQLARWGRFSVLGHFTLPLRYFNEMLGMHMTFDGFEEEMAEIFKVIIAAGRGIELNTNRGKTPLPDRAILKLYHDLGGEIITLGSDAHTPEFVGCVIRERQALLRELGFRYFVTFEKLEPVYHKL